MALTTLLTLTAGSAFAEMPAAPYEGGPRNWQTATDTALHADTSSASDLVATLDAGTILDPLDFREVDGAVWMEAQPFGGGPVGYVAFDDLEPAVGPDGAVATGPNDSPLRAGQGEFDATGKVPCAQEAGQPMGLCDFGVARAGGGDATVVVTRPDGRHRALFFRRGQATGANTSEAEPGEFSVEKDSDLHRVRVGEERYEIPDAAILGG